MKAPDRIWRLLILSAILLPFLAVALSVASLPDAAVQGDDAVMELGVRQTMRGENLLGPYSRFHFNHPGPAYFHVMVPLYAFSGAAHGSFLLTAVLVNLLAVLLILFAIGDRPQGMLATALPLSLFLLHAGPELLFRASNAFLPVLPFTCAIFCFAAACAGRPQFWIPAVLFSSFAAQSHVAYLGLSAVIGLTSLVVAFFPATVGGARSKFRDPFLVIASVVLAACWTPSLYEQLTAPQGNLTKLSFFFGLDHRLTEWEAAGRILVGELTSPFLFDNVAPGTRAFLSWLLILLLPLVFVSARRAGNRPAAALSLLASVGLLAGFFSLRRIVGPIHEYLIHWIPVLGMTGLTAILLLALQQTRLRLPRIASASTALLGLLLALSSCLNLAADWDLRPLEGWPRIPSHRQTETLVREATRNLQLRGLQAPEIRIAPGSAWPVAAGLILQFDKLGRDYCVEEFWLFMFGKGSVCGELREGTLIIGDGSLAVAVKADPRFEPVASAGSASVYLARSAPEPSQIDFSAPEAALYLKGGFVQFSRIEPGLGRWSLGNASILHLPLTPGRPYLLTLRAQPLPVVDRVQMLRVVFNRQPLSELPMLSREMDYLIPLPAGQVAAQNQLRFEYSYADPPMRHFEGSTDWRPLAVHFRSLRVTPQP